MAKIEFTHAATEHTPASTETIEVRVWGRAGEHWQPFYIGSGFNYRADHNYWLEVNYSVEGAPIFYTRSFMQHDTYQEEGQDPTEWQHSRLDKIVQDGEGSFGFGDMLPETGLVLKIEKHKYPFAGEEDDTTYTTCQLEIIVDTSSVFGRTAPGERSINIKLEIELDQGVGFMRDLVGEFAAAKEGRHPDPASFPYAAPEWPFAARLNTRAYDSLAGDYQEDYFARPLLAEAFDGWLEQVRPFGRVLDAGCGHGEPVAVELLKRGFEVTGSDFSPAMLARARQQFPQADFVQQPISGLTFEAEFDAACSLSSLLYLDPIDLLHGIQRLHAALKPGGLLFLYAYDLGPSWRGLPFRRVMQEWMWSWHYGMDEAAALLEEHGCFEVLDARKVFIDPDAEQKYQDALEERRQQEEEYNRKRAADPEGFPYPFSSLPVEQPGYAYTITARRCER